ncbi:hypothetical protein [Glutamicibacter sp. NPDC090743]|uniref:hypothetical protein n=1 Tax=Glutamicibacter sp. NPDC090743 TaxID=3364001 RepID=UPI0037FAB1D3
MPIVLAEPHELLDDVRGLVSVHGRSVLVAIYDETADHLSFWFISVPNPALENVPVEPRGQIMRQFIAQSTPDGARTFRVRYWGHSAIAFEIPCYVRSDRHHQTSYNTRPGTLGNPEPDYPLDNPEPAA